MIRSATPSILFLMIVMTTSCINEYDAPSGTDETMLVVNAELEAGRGGQSIYIGNSFQTLDQSVLFDEDLKVEIYEFQNAEPYIPTLINRQEGEWKLPDSLIFEKNKSYVLKIDPAQYGLEPIFAETVIPHNANVIMESVLRQSDSNSFELTLDLTQSQRSVKHLELQLFVLDENGNKIFADEFYDKEGIPLFIVNRNASGILIDLEKLPDAKYLTFIADFWLNNPHEIRNGQFLYISLRSVTEDYYLYKRSLSETAISNNPFSLPNTTFTNISNGFGLFAVYNTVTDSLLIQG